MRAPRLIAYALGVMVALSCVPATFTFISGGAGGGGGSLSGSGSPSASSSSSHSVAASSSTSTGSGGSCSENPCRLVVPQCGCPAGTKCSVSPPSFARGCEKAGAAALDSPCAIDADCGPGLFCLQVTAKAGQCVAFCAGDADCVAPGGLCDSPKDVDGGEIPNLTTCTTDCDPLTNAGCMVPGTSCRIIAVGNLHPRFGTACLPSGDGGTGAPCTDNTGCGPEFGCVLVPLDGGMQPGQCVQFCDTSQCACPQNFCNPFQVQGQNVVVGGTTYGGCGP